MKRFRCQLVKGVVALLGGLAWLGVTTTAIADPFVVHFPTNIYWDFDFPFVPSTVSGVSTVFTDRLSSFPPTEFEDEDPAGGSTDVTPSYLLIYPGETILWSLGGSLAYGDLTFPFCAYAEGVIPDEPCGRFAAPMIPIATLTNAHFGHFSVTGPVYAFDDAVHIGTWRIWSDDRLIPEPTTLALLAIGAAGLGTLRRRD